MQQVSPLGNTTGHNPCIQHVLIPHVGTCRFYELILFKTTCNVGVKLRECCEEKLEKVVVNKVSNVVCQVRY